jgi:DNA mismatch repair protein MutL
MGFRGEALPSIASVSRFTLTTRERDNASPEGTQIVVNGGKITEVKAAGCATGTTLEVRQLFFNVPARRKFLRTEETESAHIQHYVTLAALAHPGIAFTFIKDTRVVWQLPAVKSGRDAAARLDALRERLRAVLGGEERLLAVDATGELNWSEGAPDEAGPETAGPARKSSMRVWGFIGAPGVSRSTREDQHLFVNRRPVENRGLNYALAEGYHTALMKGRFPLCCLFVEIDPALVDVNIHPAKREVKFHREFEVRRVVMNAVRQTLLNFHTATAPVSRAVSEPAKSAALSASPPVPAAIEPSLPKFELSPAPAPAPVPQHREQPALPMGFAPAARPVPATAKIPAAPAVTAVAPTASPVAPVAAPLGTGAVPLLQVPLRMVGVIGRLYVVLESDRGLVLLDQHAAHERILYEQMLTRVEQNGQAPLQRLLLPETLELSVRDATFLRQQMETLTRLGVGLSEFGERTFLLDALPPFVKVSDARRFALELVDELKAAGEDVNSARLGEQVVAKTVCRHAVKANDPLAGRELENLVEDLRRCAMPYTCPHGRPTLIEMGWRELERKFGRAQ